MKIVQISQIENPTIFLKDCDILICGCGYEERCTSFVSNYIEYINRIPQKYVFTYTSPKVQELENHEKFFTSLNFVTYPITETECVFNVLEKVFSVTTYKEHLKIIIDYSSMERQWYSKILLFLNKFRHDTIVDIVCGFVYSIPEYVADSLDKKYNINGIEALPGFSSISIPDKPTALIVGLGTNEKALSSLRYFADIDYVHYFCTDSRFVPSLKDMYQMLWNRYSSDRMHEYDLKNMVSVFNTLCDIYNTIKEKYRLVVISCGPKPFTLMSLFFAQIYGIDVWYMKNNLSNHSVVKKSIGEYICLGVEYMGF